MLRTFAGVGRAALLCVVAGAAVPAVHAEPPSCAERQLAEWRFVRDFQMGVSVRDAKGHFIGTYANQKKAAYLEPGALGGRNWFPGDVTKKTLCGSVERFTLFQTPLTGEESDFHPWIRPAAPFAHMLEDARAIGKARGAATIYGEVTVPRSFRNSNWFDLRQADAFGSREVHSPDRALDLWGRHACMYGPWVYEELHENVPEIHPMEALWFRHPEVATEVRLLLIQDASNRFQQPEYFCLDRGAPVAECGWEDKPGFVPWAQGPMTHRVRVAYELDRDVAEALSQRVRHIARGPLAPEAGEETRLEIRHGKQTLAVISPPTEPGRFVVTDEGGCTSEGGRRLHGYVAIETTFGDRGGRAGYHELAVGGADVVETPRLQLIENGLTRLADGALQATFEVRMRAGLEAASLTLDTGAIVPAQDGRVDIRVAGPKAPGPVGFHLTGHREARGKLPHARPRIRFKDVDDTGDDKRWRGAESDLEVVYEPDGGEGSQDLAGALNLVLRGKRSPEALYDRELFSRIFGRSGCVLRVVVGCRFLSDGQGAECQTRQGKRPQSTQAGIVWYKVEDFEKSCAPKYDNPKSSPELLDLQLWWPRDLKEPLVLELTATLKDWFSQEAEEARQVLRVDPSATDEAAVDTPLDADGLLALPSLAASLAATAGIALAELRSLWSLDRGLTESAEASFDAKQLCGGRARLARFLLLFGRSASRDGTIIDAESQGLDELARKLKSMPPDDPRCLTTGP